MIVIFDVILLFALCAFRGLYLLVLIPATFLGWIFVHSWRQRTSYGACLGWYDWNIFLSLATGLVGVRASKYMPTARYVRLVDMANISHRVGWMGRTLQKLDSDPLQSRAQMGLKDLLVRMSWQMAIGARLPG